MKKIAYLAAAATLTLSANAFAGAKDDAASAIEAAVAAAKKADSVGYEWRDTGKMIKSAQAAMEKGKYKDAIKLAKEAEAQGNLAYKQYEQQKGAASRN